MGDWRPATPVAIRVAARLTSLELQHQSVDSLLCQFETPSGTRFTVRLWSGSPLWIRWSQRLRLGRIYDLLIRQISGQHEPVELLQIAEVPQGPDTEPEAHVSYEQLVAFLQREIADAAIRELVLALLGSVREALVDLPASKGFHHTGAGGLIKHTLTVTKLAASLADELANAYPTLRSHFKRDLVLAGAALHDLGKVEELLPREELGDSAYAIGRLLGHWVTLQDRLSNLARAVPVDPIDLAVLRHIIYAHQTTQRGGPADPQTLEAMIVAAADGLDSHVDAALQEIVQFHDNLGFTSHRNPLGRRLLVRRLPSDETGESDSGREQDQG